MIIYWITWFYICFCNIFIASKNKFSKLFFVLTSIYLFVFVGFRYQVGGDWYNYIYFYDLTRYSSLNAVILGGDPGYNLLNFLGNSLGYSDTIFVNVVCAFLILLFLTKLALKLKAFWLFFLVYYPYHIVVVSNGYTRQAVAISICLWGVYKLLQNKRKKFIFFILLAAMFHKTAIVFFLLFPVVFLYYIKNNLKYLMAIYSFFSFILIVFLLNFLGMQESNIYLQGNEEMSSKGFFVRWTYHVIPLIIFYKYNNFFKTYYYYPILQYLSFLILLLFPLGFVFSTLADRFNLYLIFFDVFVLCSSFFYISEYEKRLLVAVLIVFYSLQMFIWFFYGEWAMKAWVPYKNYITNYLFNSVF